MTRILLVEDNEMNRDMLSRRLTKRGYDVRVAVDGEQGIDLARREEPDLVLMDMSLPGVDGWEATRLLKADSATRHIPIIAITAHAIVTATAMSSVRRMMSTLAGCVTTCLYVASVGSCTTRAVNSSIE